MILQAIVLILGLSLIGGLLVLTLPPLRRRVMSAAIFQNVQEYFAANVQKPSVMRLRQEQYGGKANSSRAILIGKSC